MSGESDQPAVTVGFVPDLSMDLAGGIQPPSLPLLPADYWNKVLVRQPSKIEGEAAHISMRIPIEWMEAISVLRDWQKDQFPSRVIWPTVSDFARSALADFIETVSRLRESMEQGELPTNSSTGLIGAQMIAEQIDGELLARTKTMQRVQSQAYKLSQAIRDLMNRREPVEAADMISSYVARTIRLREETGHDFWERFFINSLFRIPSMIEDATSLIQGEYIIDEDVIANLEHVTHLIENGELDLYIHEDDQPVDSLPLDNITATGVTNDTDTDTSSDSGQPG